MPKRGRDELRTPAKFDSTRTGTTDRNARRFALAQRAADNTGMRLQYNQTIALLRFAKSGGTPEYGIGPTVAPISGMDALPALVGGFETGEVTINGEKRRMTTRTFTIYGVPEVTAPTGERIAWVLLTDQIKFEDDVYDIVSVTVERYSGRNVVRAALRVA